MEGALGDPLVLQLWQSGINKDNYWPVASHVKCSKYNIKRVTCTVNFGIIDRNFGIAGVHPKLRDNPEKIWMLGRYKVHCVAMKLESRPNVPKCLFYHYLIITIKIINCIFIL